MAKKPSASQLRDVRIELLRARAAVERQALARGAHSLATELTPAALVRGMLPRGLSGRRPTDWLFQGARLLRRYPYLLSAASTVLSGVRKRHRLLRIGAGLLLSWGLARKAARD